MNSVDVFYICPANHALPIKTNPLTLTYTLTQIVKTTLT